ncbi:MAG: helix-turn-helix transcriptional regulator [Acidobacteriota bacterium]
MDVPWPHESPVALHTPEEIAEELAGKLRELRLQRGWKQETLARRAGVSLASLRRFESGSQISLDRLLRLAFALGRLDDFTSILDPPPARTLDEIERLASRPRRQRGRH